MSVLVAYLQSEAATPGQTSAKPSGLGTRTNIDMAITTTTIITITTIGRHSLVFRQHKSYSGGLGLLHT